jgi:hypothetical protein
VHMSCLKATSLVSNASEVVTKRLFEGTSFPKGRDRPLESVKGTNIKQSKEVIVSCHTERFVKSSMLMKD